MSGGSERAASLYVTSSHLCYLSKPPPTDDIKTVLLHKLAQLPSGSGTCTLQTCGSLEELSACSTMILMWFTICLEVSCMLITWENREGMYIKAKVVLHKS